MFVPLFLRHFLSPTIYDPPIPNSPSPNKFPPSISSFSVSLPSLSSMASLTLHFYILFIFLISIFSTTVHSLNCTAQKLNSNKNFPNCTDLPHLSAYLHYNYNSTNSSLSVAYVAALPKPGGWVAWAINPTGTGMAGAQAFIAYKVNGKMGVHTYNISSSSSIVPGKLSFDSWDLSAEESSNNVTIFASVKVPEKAESLNQVWQVGSAVTDGMPMKHDFFPANLNAKGTLQLVTASQNSSGNSSTGGGDKSGVSSINGGRPVLGLFMSLVLFSVTLISV